MRIVGTEFDVSPREKPLTYPGKLPGHSFLYLGDVFARIRTTEGRRLGQAVVVWEDEDGDLCGPHETENLNACLLRLGAASIDMRVPVLAYGSNATPGQLRRKFQDKGIPCVIPVVQARASDMVIAYSAHLADYGAVPATVINAPNSVSHVAVSFLDRQQLEVLDDSEPNYRRVRVRRDDHAVALESGETLAGVDAYVSKHGALLVDGAPRFLVQDADPPASPMRSEQELLDELLVKLAGTLGGAVGPEQFVERVQLGKLSPAEVTSAMRGGLDLTDAIGEQGETSVIYRDTDPTWDEESRLVDVAGHRGRLLVRPNFALTATGGRPRGDFVVAVSPETHRRLGLGRFALVRNPYHGLVLAVPVRVHEETPDGVVLADQIVRNALGLEVREYMDVAPTAWRRWERVKQAVLPTRRLVMRAQIADIAVVETQMCLMAPAAIEMLGISSGDEVVLEGPSETGRLVEIPRKAIATPDGVEEQRQRLLDESIEARFPDCSAALGVYPDLPWIFLDADARRLLGVRSCSPVRVRASRRYQLWKHFREYALLLAVAVFGAVSAVDTPSVKAVLIAVLVLFVFAIAFWGLRRRLD